MSKLLNLYDIITTLSPVNLFDRREERCYRVILDYYEI